MDLMDHFRVIYRRRWPVLLASLLVASLAYAWSVTRPPVYRAKALISVTSGRAVSGESVTEEDTLFLTRNYAELARTRPVVADAASRSGLRLSPGEARHRLSSQAASDVGFLTITADGPSPASATALANGAVDALLAAVTAQQSEALREALAPVESEIQRLEGELNDLRRAGVGRVPLDNRYEALVQKATERLLAPTDRLAVVAAARAESQPVSPTPVRDAVLVLLAALVVNAELAVVVEALRDRFSTQDQDDAVTEVTGLPVLARVPESGGEPTVEAIRTLRTNLMFMETTERLRTVAVVSADPSAGKTFTALRLAESVASLGVPVVLVDGDLRRPSLHRQLGLSSTPGLGDLLRGASLERVLRPAPDNEHLDVMTAGSSITDPAGALGGRQFRTVLEQLDQAGMVVVDTPACALFADGLAIASQCDAAIVIVDADGTRRRSVRRLVHQLKQVGSNPIGVVINRVEPESRSRYSYYRYRSAEVASR
ncbi:MAG TPA: polysaccharide biosynthesis tyrosine autokinase [Acidimicrobiales bacterium]|nr:polysaccharide biosynthesis tyrosine autokinase [Acidimicrobiales bacterium]